MLTLFALTYLALYALQIHAKNPLETMRRAVLRSGFEKQYKSIQKYTSENIDKFALVAAKLKNEVFGI
jgi:hypothetical protein